MPFWAGAGAGCCEISIHYSVVCYRLCSMWLFSQMPTGYWHAPPVQFWVDIPPFMIILDRGSLSSRPRVIDGNSVRLPFPNNCTSNFPLLTMLLPEGLFLAGLVLMPFGSSLVLPYTHNELISRDCNWLIDWLAVCPCGTQITSCVDL